MDEQALTLQPIRFVSRQGVREQDRSGERPRIRHVVPLTTSPSPAVGFTEPSWDWLEKTASPQTQGSEVRGGGVTEVVVPDGDFDELEEAQQVGSSCG